MTRCSLQRLGRNLLQQLRTLLPSAGMQRQQGLQLAGAVALAFGVAKATGLPDPFWAVMSVLIVMRPAGGATLQAAWLRVRNTLLGALAGLLGVGLMHFGVPPVLASLGILGALGYSAGANSQLRTAAVAALIVLSAAASPHAHAPLEMALLRIVQIVIGVAVASLVAHLGTPAASQQRLRAGCARLLRGSLAAWAPGAPYEARAFALDEGLAKLRALALSLDGGTPARGNSQPLASAAPRNQDLVTHTRNLLNDLDVLCRVAMQPALANDAEQQIALRAEVKRRVMALAQALDGGPPAAQGAPAQTIAPDDKASALAYRFDPALHSLLQLLEVDSHALRAALR